MKTVLLVLCLVVAGCDQPKLGAQAAEPDAQRIGRYQLTGDPKGGVWEIDTTTGIVFSYCFTSAVPPGCVRPQQR